MVTVLAVVVVLDQVVKAWAWRSLADVHINSGGNAYSGAGLRDALDRPVSGAVLDVADAVLLAAAVLVVVRVVRSRPVALAGAAVLGGWISNIGDRLGLHFLTAPHSVRGVVDFVPLDGHYWNLADFVILGGSVSFVAAVGWVRVRRTVGPATAPRHGRGPSGTGQRATPVPARPGVLTVLVGLAVLAVLVALAVVGATAGGTLDHPRPHPAPVVAPARSPVS